MNHIRITIVPEQADTPELLAILNMSETFASSESSTPHLYVARDVRGVRSRVMCAINWYDARWRYKRA
jgi:hypothetical protein